MYTENLQYSEDRFVRDIYYSKLGSEVGHEKLFLVNILSIGLGPFSIFYGQSSRDERYRLHNRIIFRSVKIICR